MSYLAPTSIVTWFVLPSFFALIVAGLRALAARRRPEPPRDRDEKFALATMLAPFALGLALIPVAASMPDVIPAFPATTLPVEGEGGSAAPSTTVVAASIPWSLVAKIAAALYGLAVLWRIIRVGHARSDLSNIAGRSRPSPFGEDILETDDLTTPVVDEKGRVLLPQSLLASLAEVEIDLIVAHERAHHARGDQRYFVVLALIDAVFWIHPGVRWQTARCRLAAEIACDIAACAGRPEMRRTYAELIVRALQHAAGSALPCAPAVFSPRTKGEFGMRLTEIMRPRSSRSKAQTRMLAVAAALVLPFGAAQWASAKEGATADFAAAVMNEGKITSTFGVRAHPLDGTERWHHGTDIAAPTGTPVYAPAAGVVTKTEWSEGYGNLLEVTHEGGTVTRYAQLEGFEVSIGDKVWAGQTIARVGSTGRSTGPHLHLEVFIAGQRVDPQDMIKMPAGR